MHRFLVILALSTACSASLGTRSPAPRNATTVLEVRNNHWEDVTVFVLKGEVPSKVGVVSAMRSRTFTLADAEIGSGSALRLAAETFGSHERSTSESVNVVPGNRIYWVVEGRMKYSSIMIR